MEVKPLRFARMDGQIMRFFGAVSIACSLPIHQSISWIGIYAGIGLLIAAQLELCGYAAFSHNRSRARKFLYSSQGIVVFVVWSYSLWQLTHRLTLPDYISTQIWDLTQQAAFQHLWEVTWTTLYVIFMGITLFGCSSLTMYYRHRTKI